jgi:hypothetical protein
MAINRETPCDTAVKDSNSDADPESEEPEMNDEAITEGVRDSWDFFLKQNHIAIEFLIRGEIGSAVKEWLDENKDEIIAAIAQRQLEASPERTAS